LSKTEDLAMRKIKFKRSGKEKSSVKSKSRRWNVQEKIFLFLVVVILILGSLNIVKAKGWLIPESKDFFVQGKTVDLSQMPLEKKIAQMIIVHGSTWNEGAWKRLGVGGIHLFALANADIYKEIIQGYQKRSTIPLLVSADFEGCLNPFSNFHQSTAVSEINTHEEAFNKGKEDGKFMKGLGFTLNFAPVVDLEDEIWKCRSFPGDEKEVSELAEAYILGLQEAKIISTAKHYPGGTLVGNDPHKQLVTATIKEQDLYPYQQLIGSEVIDSIMVSHLITNGAVNSEGYPSVASEDVVGALKGEFNGLVISDEIQMAGLRDFYDTLDEMYLAVFKSGNDLILNFDEDPLEVYRMVKVVEEAVQRGEISEERIDNSVRKILTVKGLVVE